MKVQLLKFCLRIEMQRQRFSVLIQFGLILLLALNLAVINWHRLCSLSCLKMFPCCALVFHVPFVSLAMHVCSVFCMGYFGVIQ